MTANTWVARLVELSRRDREIVLEYLTGMDQAGPVPTVKWLKERVKQSDLRAARQTQADDHAEMSV